jgi:virginiamycin B lyase
VRIALLALLGAAVYCSSVSGSAAAAAPAVVEYPLTAGTAPRGIVLAQNGNAVQFAQSGPRTLATMSEKGRYAERLLPFRAGPPEAAAVGPDGAVWVTQGGRTVTRVQGGKYRRFTLPAGSRPVGISAGAHALWIAEQGSGRIARMSLTGSLRQFPIPGAGDAPTGLVFGPDGAVWFTEPAAGAVGRLVPATGAVQEISLGPGSGPSGIAVGPGGNLWVTEQHAGAIAVIPPTGNEPLAVYTLPAGSRPRAIVAAVDGALWYTDPGLSEIGRIATDGTVSALPLAAGARPYAIAQGPRGRLYFTQSTPAAIGRIDLATAHTQYVEVGATVIEPDPPRLQLGSTVSWQLVGPSAQSVTDATGMELFDSGVQSFFSTFSFQFTAAGTYPFRSTTSGLDGSIKVLPALTPRTVASGSPVTVSWASAPPAAGYAFDVRYRRDGSATWTPWQSQVAATSAAYVTPRTGKYAFEARLVNTSTVPATASDWSSPVVATAS